MCLHGFYWNWERVKELKVSGKTIKAYKLLSVRPGETILRSLYKQKVIWRVGKIKTSDRKGKSSTIPTPEEKRLDKIFKGLHFYRTREAARQENYGDQIWQVEINPKDLVTVGDYDQLVAHKAKLIRRVR